MSDRLRVLPWIGGKSKDFPDATIAPLGVAGRRERRRRHGGRRRGRGRCGGRQRACGLSGASGGDDGQAGRMAHGGGRCGRQDRARGGRRADPRARQAEARRDLRAQTLRRLPARLRDPAPAHERRGAAARPDRARRQPLRLHDPHPLRRRCGDHALQRAVQHGDPEGRARARHGQCRGGEAVAAGRRGRRDAGRGLQEGGRAGWTVQRGDRRPRHRQGARRPSAGAGGHPDRQHGGRATIWRARPGRRNSSASSARTPPTSCVRTPTSPTRPSASRRPASRRAASNASRRSG